MLANRFVGQLVDSASRDIVLKLPIPFIRVEREEPYAEFRELIWGQFRNSLFELLERHF